ncbi:YciI family protein [Martelella limonii]|uniref:YciI family protein n=1 Tax=Martelella limonii TaxID=1647649 RepID=UPI001580EC8D|nr:YciI family protein [Martelella limonii]
MHYIVHCLDYEGKVQDRLDHYEAHKAYLSSNPIKMVISGPLLAEDETTMIGSCFLVEADSIEEVVKYHENDPFYRAGIWEKVSIHPFNKRVDNRS